MMIIKTIISIYFIPLLIKMYIVRNTIKLTNILLIPPILLPNSKTHTHGYRSGRTKWGRQVNTLFVTFSKYQMIDQCSLFSPVIRWFEIIIRRCKHMHITYHIWNCDKSMKGSQSVKNQTQSSHIKNTGIVYRPKRTRPNTSLPPASYLYHLRFPFLKKWLLNLIDVNPRYDELINDSPN